MTGALVGTLSASADGRTVLGRFQCGGTLRETETSHTVTITYIASRVRAGGMACAMVPVSVHLSAPLGSRDLVDGVTGQRLQLHQ